MTTINGGNGRIRIDKERGLAIKEFKNVSTRDKVSRFKREIEVISSLSKEGFPGIVPIYNVSGLESNNYKDFKITMKLCKGTLNDLCEQTKGNPNFTFKLLIPVIQTLKALSERDPPIYHRDLKPENILFDEADGSVILYLTDFGLCYIDDDKAERLTPMDMAVGSRFYMAPEYERGFVERVDEKGDIYSLGKIIWFMINGVRDDRLPSNLWFIDDFDLSKKFVNDCSVLKANIILASCLSIKPENRCNYTELLTMMSSINTDFSSEGMFRTEIILFNEKRNLVTNNILKMNCNIVNLFCTYFNNVLEWYNTNNKIELISHISNRFKKPLNGDYISENIINNSTHYLFSCTFDTIYISITYHPASGDEKYSKIVFEYNIKSQINNKNQMTVYYNKHNVIQCNINNSLPNEFNEQHLFLFIKQMVKDYIKSFENYL